MYFAVVGSKVRGKSASPAMHMASFRRLGIEAEYWALDVPRDGLSCFVQLARFNLQGFNVTMPHKEEMLKFLDAASPEVRAVGAVNTVKIERNLLVGYNTDATAVYRLAGSHMKGARVLIIGAGGAARAALFAVVKAEAGEIYLMNRSRERAEALAAEFGGRFGRSIEVVNWGHPPEVDVAINATPVHDQTLAAPRSLLVDFVYIPTPRTKMVEAAERAGVKAIDGVELLVEQGAQAEEIWLGVEPDRSVMRRTVLKFLGYEHLR